MCIVSSLVPAMFAYPLDILDLISKLKYQAYAFAHLCKHLYKLKWLIRLLAKAQMATNPIVSHPNNSDTRREGDAFIVNSLDFMNLKWYRTSIQVVNYNGN